LAATPDVRVRVGMMPGIVRSLLCMHGMEEFSKHRIDADGIRIFACVGGRGPALLLLHGFPETQLMWRDVAPRLARDFTVVCADLPGYGESGCRASAQDHEPHSKRSMARDLGAVMERLGFPRFSVAGHDRGGRVAYRMAFDHPDKIVRVAVLDVLPTETVWTAADDRTMLGFWPWSLLAQPEPLPERVLTSLADAVVEHALDYWGTPREVFRPEVRAAYVDALRDPNHAHAICEEYRAAATIDREHDRADRANERKIKCHLLALWSARGPLGKWYADQGGPLVLWRSWAERVQGQPIEGGHFFPEEMPKQTAEMLVRFFADESAP
jgi:haloacetate dehalogenase